MISQSSHSGLSWTDFIQRVGHLFHDLRMDSLDIARAAYSDEPTVVRALAEWRDRRKAA